MLLLLVAGGVFCAWKFVGGHKSNGDDAVLTESHSRLLRSEIPKMSPMSYSEMFPDMNDVQIEAARRNGLRNPDNLTDPADSYELVRVETCGDYVVDTLRHSKPYLVPQAARLLTYVGHRFEEIQTERQVKQKVRPIVTSLLRSSHDVGRLRRVNRNASENSCHVYGTTFDISYTRFMDENGRIVTEDPIYKELLAAALYELRFEGLCYVRYERRQPCFHITVRTVDYDGDLASQTVEYEIGNGSVLTAMAEKETVETPVKKEVTEVTVEKEEKKETNANEVKPEEPVVKKNNDVRSHSKDFDRRTNYVFD